MDLNQIYDNVIEGEAEKVEAGVEAALAAGTNAEQIGADAYAPDASSAVRIARQLAA